MSQKESKQKPNTGSYNLIQCQLCPKMLTFRDVQEAVIWAMPTPRGFWEWDFWYEPNSIPDFLYAHRACWNRISEIRRALIRYKAAEKYQPVYLSV